MLAKSEKFHCMHFPTIKFHGNTRCFLNDSKLTQYEIYFDRLFTVVFKCFSISYLKIHFIVL